MLPGEPEYEQILSNYRKMMAAAPHGAEAVQKVMQEISPGNPDWVQAAWLLLQERKESIPHFIYADPDFGGDVCFPPTERPLRKLLIAEEEKAKAHSSPED